MSEPEIDRTDELADRSAAFLEANAEAFVLEWIAWLQGHPTPTPRTFAGEAQRHHMRRMLQSLAGGVRTPLGVVGAELAGPLEVYARHRFEQGHPLDAILDDLDGLADIVTERLVAFLAETESCGPDALEVLARLGHGLRTIGRVTVSICRDGEQCQQSDVATRLDALAGAIAHEIRGSLNTAQLGSDLLAADDQTPGNSDSRAEYAQMTRQALRRASRLVDHLVHSATMRDGGRRISVRQAIEAAREALHSVAEERAVRIEIVDPIPAVTAPSMALQIALMNLIGNAIEHSDPGKQEARVRVTAERARAENGDSCTVTVEDNGPGMTAELLGRILRGGFPDPNHLSSGLGLGLSTTRQLLDQAGGAMAIESEAGRGTVARFTLPVIDPTDPAGDWRDIVATNLAERATDPRVEGEVTGGSERVGG